MGTPQTWGVISNVLAKCTCSFKYCFDRGVMHKGTSYMPNQPACDTDMADAAVNLAKVEATLARSRGNCRGRSAVGCQAHGCSTNFLGKLPEKPRRLRQGMNKPRADSSLDIASQPQSLLIDIPSI